MKYVLLFIINEVQGLEEHFRDSCGGVIRWLDNEASYTAFSEGWGLYAENPLIGEDTDTYKDEPWQKYGMLKWQVSYTGRIPQFLFFFLRATREALNPNLNIAVKSACAAVM